MASLRVKLAHSKGTADVRPGSDSTKLGGPHDVRFPPVSDQTRAALQNAATGQNRL
jgi:hypothetical protein